MKFIKSVTVSVLSLALVGSSVVPAMAEETKAIPQEAAVDTNIQENASNYVEMNNLISVIEPYVQVGENGKLSLKDVPQGLYEEYNLQSLEKHFDVLNAGVDKNTISINEDLSITKTGITTFASYGQWETHWWGYDRKFTNKEAGEFSDYCYSIAGGAGMATGIGAFFPPVAAVTGLSAGYFSLMGARASANNKGNGIYVACSWVAVFDIEPL